MFKKALLAASAVALSFGAAAGPNEGDWEIVFTNAGGALTVVDGDFTLGAGIKAGYFFTQNHEFGLQGAMLANDDDELFGLGGFYRYNWQNGSQPSWWFAGVDLDIADAEEAGDSIYLRPHFGRKWMLSDDIAFDIDAGVSIDADDSDNDEVLNVQFGLTVFF